MVPGHDGGKRLVHRVHRNHVYVLLVGQAKLQEDEVAGHEAAGRCVIGSRRHRLRRSAAGDRSGRDQPVVVVWQAARLRLTVALSHEEIPGVLERRTARVMSSRPPRSRLPGTLNPGVMHTVATGSGGHLGLYRLDTQITSSNRKVQNP